MLKTPADGTAARVIHKPSAGMHSVKHLKADYINEAINNGISKATMTLTAVGLISDQ